MSQLRLVLFLSHRGSLSKWRAEGILSRELMLYLYLLKHGTLKQLVIFTYDPDDAALIAREAASEIEFGKIQVVRPKFALHDSQILNVLWGLLGPVISYRIIRQSDLLKTNQASGSWSGIIAALVFRKPLIFRMGYSLSRRFKKNGHFFRCQLAGLFEYLAAVTASRIFVTSGRQREWLTKHDFEQKTLQIPPAIDTELFKQIEEIDFSTPLITVARLSPQKNLSALIEACGELDLELTIFGDGPLKDELQALARKIGAEIRFAGQVRNHELANRLVEHCIFVLPSLQEGLPKALMEAMASGLICAGSNIPGISELIEDGRTGYLIDGFDSAAIAIKLRQILDDQNQSIGRNASELINQAFAVHICCKREAAVYAELF